MGRTRYHYWFSSPVMTIYVGTDKRHVVTETAPIAKTFVGQHSKTLAAWMRAQGEPFYAKRLALPGGTMSTKKGTVVNLKKYKGKAGLNKAFGGNWTYIGRGSKRDGLDRSPLANPYSHHPRANAEVVADRKTAIEKYRQWLWGQIKAGNKTVVYALDNVDEDTVLVCYCAPMACHGEVVHRAATWMQENGGVAAVMAAARKRRRQ